MNAPLTLLAITAIAGLFVMALAGFDSEITGQGINIAKVSPEIMKKIRPAIEKEEYQPHVETNTICDCPDYGNNIITAKEHSLVAGLSYWDCQLFKEIYKIREEKKMSAFHLEQMRNYCTSKGWWGK